MKTLNRFSLALLVFAGFMVAGCFTEEPHIVCGREWNSATQTVSDTTSEFQMIDEMIVQFRYGTGFDFPSLKVTFYESESGNKGRELWNYETRVSDKVSVYTLQGKSKRGGLMTAKELTRMKAAGEVIVEATAGERLLASKKITLVKNK